MLKIRNKTLDSLNNIFLSKRRFMKYFFYMVEEGFYFLHRASLAFLNNTKATKTVHIDLFTRNVEFFIRFFASGVALEINYGIVLAIIGHFCCISLGFLIGSEFLFLTSF